MALAAPSPAAAATAAHAPGGILSFLPNFDGQTIVSIVLGSALTVLTFWIGFRKTIGAQDERQRAASSELCSSVIKRLAVERALITNEQFEALRWAKGYKLQVQSSRLIDFNGALSVALAETVDNNFLDLASKQSIISQIAQCRTEVTTTSEVLRDGARSQDRGRQKLLFSLATFSVAVGGALGIIAAELPNKLSKGRLNGGVDIMFEDRFSEIFSLMILATFVLILASAFFIIMQDRRTSSISIKPSGPAEAASFVGSSRHQ